MKSRAIRTYSWYRVSGLVMTLILMMLWYKTRYFLIVEGESFMGNIVTNKPFIQSVC